MRRTKAVPAPENRPMLAIEPPAPQAEEVFSITGLDLYTFRLLETCQRAISRANGCNQPVEQLVHDLLFAYHANRVSHAEVLELLDEYRRNAEAFQAEVREYLLQNRGLLA